MSEQRKYRSWTAQQKIEIVLAGLRGDRSVKEVCRYHHRPHSGLNYRTPDEVRRTWEDQAELQEQAA